VQDGHRTNHQRQTDDQGPKQLLEASSADLFCFNYLFTHDFFEALFFDEGGAKITRKITLVEWRGMNFFFSRYISNFDSNAQGAEGMLTHMVKV
jgi:hypothetical protein